MRATIEPRRSQLASVEWRACSTASVYSSVVNSSGVTPSSASTVFRSVKARVRSQSSAWVSQFEEGPVDLRDARDCGDHAPTGRSELEVFASLGEGQRGFVAEPSDDVAHAVSISDEGFEFGFGSARLIDDGVFEGEYMPLSAGGVRHSAEAEFPARAGGIAAGSVEVGVVVQHDIGSESSWPLCSSTAISVSLAWLGPVGRRGLGPRRPAWPCTLPRSRRCLSVAAQTTRCAVLIRRPPAHGMRRQPIRGRAEGRALACRPG